MALLVTPLGWWLCWAMVCAIVPAPGLQGYWKRDRERLGMGPGRTGALLITVEHRAWTTLHCQIRMEGATVSTWWCQ